MTDNTPREGEPAQPGSGPADAPGYGQQPPYGQAPYGQAPYGQAPYGQPPYGQPPYGPPRYPGYGAGGWNTAGAPQPGGIPLRPLGLSDILNGSFAAIRRNPAATVGLAAIVLAISGIVTTAFSLSVAHVASTAPSLTNPNGTFNSVQFGHDLSSIVPLLALSVVLSLLADIVLTGLLTVVIGRGVLGQELTMGQAWNLVRPRLAAVFGVTMLIWLILVGLWVPYVLLLIVFIAAHITALAVIWGILGFVALIVAEVTAWVRFSLAAPVVVLEQLGPGRALRRSWQLVANSFWRLFGIFLLTAIIVFLAGAVLQIPFDLGRAALGSTSAAGIILVGIGGIIVGAVTRPVLAGVTVLLYVDMRMRKEGLDLVLRDAAQKQAMTGDEFAALWRAPAPGQGAPATPPTSW